MAGILVSSTSGVCTVLGATATSVNVVVAAVVPSRYNALGSGHASGKLLMVIAGNEWDQYLKSHSGCHHDVRACHSSEVYTTISHKLNP